MKKKMSIIDSLNKRNSSINKTNKNFISIPNAREKKSNKTFKNSVLGNLDYLKPLVTKARETIFSSSSTLNSLEHKNRKHYKQVYNNFFDNKLNNRTKSLDNLNKRKKENHHYDSMKGSLNLFDEKNYSSSISTIIKKNRSVDSFKSCDKVTKK